MVPLVLDGPFGFGWSLSAPSVSLRTSRGVPKYQGDDVYTWGGQDLVPMLTTAGLAVERSAPVQGYAIHRYLPRVEGSHSRIERWVSANSPVETHWRVVSSDNVLSIFGASDESRVCNPQAKDCISAWLLCEMRDQCGNACFFRYKKEDGVGVDVSQPHQSNRGSVGDSSRAAARYIKSIVYGNILPMLDEDGRRPHFLTVDQRTNSRWMFEIVFDYGEHDDARPTPGDSGDWSYRHDAFSSRRCGFEVRTTRLCKRVLMFHHFPNEPDVGLNCLVRTTNLSYSQFSADGVAVSTGYSYLLSVSQLGFKRRGEGYIIASLPPTEFAYSLPEMDGLVETIDDVVLESLAPGIASGQTQLVDLYGEGIPGLLTETAGSWYYARNESPLNATQGKNGQRTVRAKFGPPMPVEQRPNAARAHFKDFDGTGSLAVTKSIHLTSGYYQPASNGISQSPSTDWNPFAPLLQGINHPLQGSNVRFLDLTGDGRPDVIIAGDVVNHWYESLGTDGFGPPRSMLEALDEEKGPRGIFSNESESISVADFTGDGLSDIVRVRNRECCYWPNLGNGSFGPKISMDNCPVLDADELFQPKRVILADVDGSGSADVIYLRGSGAVLCFNQSGNGFGPTRHIDFPRADKNAVVTTVDLLGTGTLCLVSFSPSPEQGRKHVTYMPLLKAKPHLLIGLENNLGASTTVKYISSTKAYLEDRKSGRPWITKLPFAVHVVESVTNYDHISKSMFMNRYAYHHGHYDTAEREFGGFGMVEQWDTEALSVLSADGRLDMANVSEETYLTPKHSKTWYHTGVRIGSESISRHYESEYYRNETLLDGVEDPWALRDTILPAALSIAEERESCRALRGSVLRKEVYADDASPTSSEAVKKRARTPFMVSESNVAIRVAQKRHSNRHAVFQLVPNEELTIVYDRKLSDPRIAHSMSLEVSATGEVLRALSITYGRREEDAALPSEWDREQQRKTTILYTENKVSDLLDSAYMYRKGVPYQGTTYEVTGFSPPARKPFSLDYWKRDSFAELEGAETIDFQATPDLSKQQKRLLSCQRSVFRKDDLTQSLPLGQIEPLAIIDSRYILAFTSNMLDRVFRKGDQPLPFSTSDLTGVSPSDGGYVSGDEMVEAGSFPRSDGPGCFWTCSGRVRFSLAQDPAMELRTAQEHFFLPVVHRDMFAAEMSVRYDDYDLLILETRDVLGNRTTSGERDAAGAILNNAIDYRVLQPRLTTDINRNRAEVAFDALGAPVASALSGKRERREGDSLVGIDVDIAQERIQSHLAAPMDGDEDILMRASTITLHDRFAYMRTKNSPHPTPATSYTLTRTTHAADHQGVERPEVVRSFSYSDGFGRSIQRKVQVKPGLAPQRDESGSIVLRDGLPVMSNVNPRWISEGWSVHNNKGKQVRAFDPFFSDSFAYEPDIRMGSSPVMFYDGLDRLVATLSTDDLYSKSLFDPWKHEVYDAGDNALNDPRTDDAVARYTAPYFSTRPAFQTWHSQQIQSGDTARNRAAERSAVYSDTPSVTHLDSLGRPFLTVTHNRTACAGHDLDGIETRTYKRVEKDIQGNISRIWDGNSEDPTKKGRLVALTEYDMIGNAMRTVCAEKGESLVFRNSQGQTTRTWDNRGFSVRSFFDVASRLVCSEVMEASTAGEPGRVAQVERYVFGDHHPEAEERNLRGTVFMTMDQAGVTTVENKDFKGNSVRTTSRLNVEYKDIVDWSHVAQVMPDNYATPVDLTRLESTIQGKLERDIYNTTTALDAMNRVTLTTLPHTDASKANHVRLSYEVSSLTRVECNVRGQESGGALEWKPFVTRLDYNAKGQRIRVEYGNNISTDYRYDKAFQLEHLQTRTNGRTSNRLQDLSYTYDAVGSISTITDASQQTLFFRNEVVKPSNSYVYDAMKRLVQSEGREHIGQVGGAPVPYSNNDAVRSDTLPSELHAMGNYVEQYLYDSAYNIRKMRHFSSADTQRGWTREFFYEEPSKLDTSQMSNTLSRTTVGSSETKYMYDEHGNTTRLPHLGGGQGQQNMSWDFMDRLKQVDLGGGGTAFYTYAQAGGRARKVIERGPNLIEERIYLGTVEIYRQRNRAAILLERETIHVNDDKGRVALIEVRTDENEARPNQSPDTLVRYQFTNHLGSSALEVDDNARLLSLEEYSPYGSTTYQAQSTGLELPKRYRFTGKERDEETGLSYHGARYLAPWLGRWINPDPGGYQDGLNLFAYVGGNPISLSDPSGCGGESAVPGVKPGMVGLSVHEIRPVAQSGIDLNESFRRAIDLGGKRFLGVAANSSLKNNPYLGPDSTLELDLVSFAENPEALKTRTLWDMLETRLAGLDAIKRIVPEGVLEHVEKGGNLAELKYDLSNVKDWNNKINLDIKQKLTAEDSSLRKLTSAAIEDGLGGTLERTGRSSPHLQVPAGNAPPKEGIPNKPQSFTEILSNVAERQNSVRSELRGEVMRKAAALKAPEGSSKFVGPEIPPDALGARVLPSMKMVEQGVSALGWAGMVGGTLDQLDRGDYSGVAQNVAVLGVGIVVPVVPLIMAEEAAEENMKTPMAMDAANAVGLAAYKIFGNETVGVVAGVTAGTGVAVFKTAIVDQLENVGKGMDVIQRRLGVSFSGLGGMSPVVPTYGY